jgi:hypothetical protein
LDGGGATLPVVHVVKNDIEMLAGKRGSHGIDIVAVGYDFADPFAEFVARRSVQNSDFVLFLQERGYNTATYE